MFFDLPVKIPPPCHKPGEPDCRNRHVGCQKECVAYGEYRTALDKNNHEEALKRDSWNYESDSILRRKWSLRYTEAGRKALSQR